MTAGILTMLDRFEPGQFPTRATIGTTNPAPESATSVPTSVASAGRDEEAAREVCQTRQSPASTSTPQPRDFAATSTCGAE